MLMKNHIAEEMQKEKDGVNEYLNPEYDEIIEQENEFSKESEQSLYL